MPRRKAQKHNTVCIVEDSPAIAKMYAARLVMAGYRVVSAGDGAEGFGMISKERPDLVLTDLDMPRMGGLELVRELKGDAELKSIPVIVLTNHDGSAGRKEALGLGALLFLVKLHVTPSELVGVVEGVLGKKIDEWAGKR